LVHISPGQRPGLVDDAEKQAFSLRFKFVSITQGVALGWHETSLRPFENDEAPFPYDNGTE
jgi:hypothetical protein